MEFFNGESTMAMAMAIASVVAAIATAIQVWKVLWWRPHQIQWALNVQGVTGPPYRFLIGNAVDTRAMVRQAHASGPMPHLSHDILPRLFPDYNKWSETYGKMFLYWSMYKPFLIVTGPEEMKDILSNKFVHFQKPKTRPELVSMFGKEGAILLEGKKWLEHRRIFNPSFYREKLKTMVPVIADRTAVMLEKWKQLTLQGNGMKEVDALKEFKALAADILCHTAFGSSYEKSKQVFQMQHELETLYFKVSAEPYIPCTRYLPTSSNRRRWKLEKQICQCLRTLVNSRLLESSSEIGEGGGTPFGNDLLGLMMAANANLNERQGGGLSMSMGMNEIIDECKTFFVVGHETPSLLLTWTIMLMCMHPEWQERARDEVIAHCGRDAPPNVESLNHLKILSMVLNESLRLYPPIVFMLREVPPSLSSGIKVGNVRVPPGTILKIMIAAMHRDPLFWGEDAGEFNPNRFAEGTTKACKNPLAFMPFSMGPRTCVGQNFTLLEAKIVLAMLLQQHNFSFRLSPSYVHAPIVHLSLYPQHGMHIMLESISSPTKTP